MQYDIFSLIIKLLSPSGIEYLFLNKNDSFEKKMKVAL